MISWWSKVTFIMGMLMVLTPLFHIISMIAAQSSEGQSLLGAIIWQVGVMSWFIYGLLKQDWVLISVNSITAIIGLAYVITIGVY